MPAKNEKEKIELRLRWRDCFKFWITGLIVLFVAGIIFTIPLAILLGSFLFSLPQLLPPLLGMPIPPPGMITGNITGIIRPPQIEWTAIPDSTCNTIDDCRAFLPDGHEFEVKCEKSTCFVRPILPPPR